MVGIVLPGYVGGVYILVYTTWYTLLDTPSPLRLYMPHCCTGRQ